VRLTDLWQKKSKPTISFELYPARSEKAAVSLESAIDELASLKPDFVSVTFGAGGSTRQGSKELVDKLRNNKGLLVLAYFAGYGLGPEDITQVLNTYREMGIENVLVVRGDPPEGGEFTPHPESFSYASDLLAFVRPRWDLCLGAAGYPEGHKNAESKEKDLDFLKLKVEQGAKFIITNYFYDNRDFFDFFERCRKTGIDVPIIPGVMPIFSLKMMEMLANSCGATITAALRSRLSALPEGNAEALIEFGVDFALEQCRDLIGHGIPGIHIYTMDKSRSSLAIVQRLRAEGLIDG